MGHTVLTYSLGTLPCKEANSKNSSNGAIHFLAHPDLRCVVLVVLAAIPIAANLACHK